MIMAVPITVVVPAAATDHHVRATVIIVVPAAAVGSAAVVIVIAGRAEFDADAATTRVKPNLRHCWSSAQQHRSSRHSECEFLHRHNQLLCLLHSSFTEENVWAE